MLCTACYPIHPLCSYILFLDLPGFGLFYCYIVSKYFAVVGGRASPFFLCKRLSPSSFSTCIPWAPTCRLSLSLSPSNLVQVSRYHVTVSTAFADDVLN